MNSTGELQEKVYSVHKLRKYVRIGQYSQKSKLPLNSWDETESVLYGSDFFSGDSSGRHLYRVRYMLDAPFRSKNKMVRKTKYRYLGKYGAIKWLIYFV
jgi:hypothetical protein